MLVNDTATNVSIALKWTAPGDDLDEGTGKIIRQLILTLKIRYSQFLIHSLKCSFVLRTEIFGCRR